MKKRFVSFFLLGFILVLGSMVIFAQNDDQGNPNDPRVNERANACYEGGSMAGKCNTEWEWEGGWYLIRFQFGLILRENFPREFLILLPVDASATAEAEEPGGVVGASCEGPIYNSFYVDFKGGNFLASPVNAFTDSNCSVFYSAFGTNLVYTTAGSSAASVICDANLPGYAATSLGNNIYQCNP